MTERKPERSVYGMQTRAISFLLLLCSGFGFLRSTETEASDKWLIIPGKSAGFITARSSHVELQKYYGAKNVKRSRCGPEDEPAPCTRIVNDGVEVAVIYDDKTERTVILTAGDWLTAEGLKLGTSLQEIVKTNGKPVRLSKFDWDFKAEISDWGSGKLSRTFGATTTVRLFQKKGFTAQKNDRENAELKAKLLDVKDDNASFSSDEPLVQKLDLRIYEWAITLKK
jgi:hypothetical protein